MLLKTTKILSSIPIAFAGILGIMSPPAQAAYSCTFASFYGTREDGYGYQHDKMVTSSGEQFIPSKMTTAHRYLPFGTKLKVTNQSNGKSIIVTVNDRGPFVRGRGLDLSYGAFSKIASPSSGVVNVCYSKI